jgi:hypothetical protein
VHTPGQMLGAPAALTAAAPSATEVRLTWRDDSGDGGVFVLFRKRPGASYEKIATVPRTTTSYVDRGLQPGTTYIYKALRWSPTAGASPGSNEAAVTTPFAQ